MIKLGLFDPDVSESAIAGFWRLLAAEAPDRPNDQRLIDDRGPVSLKAARSALSVADLQRFLVRAAFLPGGRIDGICGYRTRAATRLFQEYVRTVEGRDCLPDGIAGNQTFAHVRRWQAAGQRAEWAEMVSAWPHAGDAEAANEFTIWLAFLRRLRDQWQRSPAPIVALAEAFEGATDTRKLADWSFDPSAIHVIGIRHGEQDASRKFDDVIVVLAKGAVFAFQASTDPGHTKHPDGAPFLVPGQHDYRFGLHRNSYLALRPKHPEHGVLVVRSKGDFELTDEDLARGVTANGTINLHWGGKGVGRGVNRWSEGCQVVAGSAYLNHAERLTDCSDYVAINNTEIKANRRKTRGAYNVLSDVIAGFSSDIPRGSVQYTLLHDADLDLDASRRDWVHRQRQRAREVIGREK